MPSSNIENIEGIILTTAVVGGLLMFLLRGLRRSRPEFHVGLPISVGFALRLVAMTAVGLLGLDATLRGGDETTYLNFAHMLASQPIGRGDFPHGIYQLQTVIFAMELKLGFLTHGAMRIVQIGIAMTGVILMLAVVYDVGGRRGARFAAWIYAFEPGSIFFNSAIDKDPNMELAGGLVVFGGAMLWRRLDVRGILICGLGGFIAIETRSYAGWFLVAAAVLLLLHAAIRNLDRPSRALPAILAIATAAIVVTPTLIELSSRSSLKKLQISQNANSSGINQATPGGTGAGNGDNLALEQVNFSSRGAILSNLPKRITALILQPYPWQLSDTSQRFGALGTLIAYAILALLVRYAWLARGEIFARAGPVLYPLFFLTVAYALSVGNAGTGFRYRTHLITLTIAAMAILRVRAQEARAPAPGVTAGTSLRDGAGEMVMTTA